MFTTLLQPAISLSWRLSFRKKFLLVFVVALLPGLFFLALDAKQSYAYIERDELELKGAEYLLVTTKLSEALADHRGASISINAGDNSLLPAITASEAEVNEALNQLNTQLKILHAEQWQAKMDDIMAAWQMIKTDWKGKPAEANFAEHTALIGKVLEYRHHVAGDTGLLLDPQADAYYLIVTSIDQFPRLREQLAQASSTIVKMAGGGMNERDAGRLDVLLNRDVVATLSRINNDLELLDDIHPAAASKVNAQWVPVMNGIHALLAEINADLAKGALSKDASGYFRQVNAAIHSLDTVDLYLQQHIIETELKPRLESAYKHLMIDVGSGLAVLFFVSWLITGFARDLTLRAEALDADMARLSDGDFTDLPAVRGNDEMSHIAHSARKLAEKLGNTMREIHANARELMTAASNVASISTQVAGSTSEQSNAAAAMAAAVEELTVSISHMSDNAGDAHRLSTDSGKASSEGGAVINQTVESMEQIAQAVRSASSNVSALGKDAEAISGIVGVIKEIADQTNLLALNAAIEAARAGETGRGFAVVADEVRKLAERTTASTKQIGEMVSRIQQGTQGVVDGMGEGVEQVESGVDLASQAGAAIAQIREGSARVVEVVSEITASLKEQSSVAHEVAGKVETIAQMSEENTRAAESSAATAEQLRGLAMSLEQKVAAFRFNEG